MTDQTYKQALNQARKELEKLLQQELELTTRIAKLRQTVGILAQLCHEEPYPPGALQDITPIANLKLVDACRLVLRASVEPLTADEIREGLVRLGYDTNQTNIIASIHTTLRRLAETGEVLDEFEKDGKKAYRFKVLPAGPGVAVIVPSETAVIIPKKKKKN